MDLQQQLIDLQTNGIELCLNELMQYRRYTQLLDLSPNRYPKNRLAGQYLAPHKGRGMEFAEVRHYQNGDDIRSIDWRVTARTGVAHTKLYQEETERPVFVVVDLSDSMLFGSQLLLKSVQAAHIAALIGWSAINRGDRIGALVFNQTQHYELKPATRTNALLRLFHQLVLAHNEAQANRLSKADFDFSAQLKRLAQLAKPGALIYVISDFQHTDSTSIKLLADVARHCEVIACQVEDPFEQNMPFAQTGLQVKTATGTWRLPLYDNAFRKRYAQAKAKQQTELVAELKKRAINLLHFSAAQGLTAQLTEKR